MVAISIYIYFAFNMSCNCMTWNIFRNIFVTIIVTVAMFGLSRSPYPYVTSLLSNYWIRHVLNFFKTMFYSRLTFLNTLLSGNVTFVVIHRSPSQLNHMFYVGISLVFHSSFFNLNHELSDTWGSKAKAQFGGTDTAR